MRSPSKPSPTALQCPQCGAGVPPGADGFAICQYCGAALVWNLPGSETRETEGPVLRGLRLKQFACTDAEGTGLEIFRMLVPVGWQSQGGCRWLLDNPGMPAAVAFQVWNPHGAEAFEILPALNFVWSSSAQAQTMYPPGSHYFGAETGPPLGVQEVMRRIVLPRYRSQVQDLQILGEEPLPDLPRLARSEAAVAGGSAEGGKVRIRYAWQGVQFEEDLYGMVEVFRTPIPSAFGTDELITWFANALFSFRAAAGRLDAGGKLFLVMISSFRLNPHWYAACKAVAQFLIRQQIQRIRHIGQIGQIVAQAGREIREQSLSDWYARQGVYDRLATDRSRAILGIDAFLDPHRQEIVELPAGYGHAWANNVGEYILTEDSDFNPNLYSNLRWEPMQPQ